MYHIVETNKTFTQASDDLDAAVKDHQFGVLHIHDIAKTLCSKGIDFAEKCRVFEVCNPIQASKILALDMSLNMALPCRISVYTEDGTTKIGFIKPSKILAGLSDDPTLKTIGNEVEATMIQMVEQAK